MKKCLRLFITGILITLFFGREVFADTAITVRPVNMGNVSSSLSKGSCGENLAWNVDKSGVLYIYGTGEMNNYNGEWPWSDVEDDIVEIEIGQGVTNISDEAFSFLENLQRVSISSTVTKIGKNAFQNCVSLKNVELYDGLRSIESNAFGVCESLKEITIPASVNNIGTNVFSKCINLEAINVLSGNRSFSTRDGVLYSNNIDKLIVYPAGKKEKYFDIPSTVDRIGFGAFADSRNLEGVTIPDTVTSIESQAFYDSSISEIHIPHSITEIGESSFRGCKNLRVIDIPEGVRKIGDAAFYYCASVKEINLPATLSQIVNYAFYGCNSLETVNYNGSESDWSKISVGIGNDILMEVNHVFAKSDLLTPDYTPEPAEPTKKPISTAKPTIAPELSYEDEINSNDESDDDYYNNNDYTDESNFEENSDLDKFNDISDDITDKNENNHNGDFIASDWARDEVNRAYEKDLIPEEMTGEDLSDIVSREEFAALAVKLYEKLSGTSTEAIDVPFDDCYNGGNAYFDYIGKAYSVGITNGVDAYHFEPESNISRQDLATMLLRVIKKYKISDWSLADDMYYNMDISGIKPFADDNDISDYAKESVYYLAKYNVILGIDETHFAPQNLTYEQIATDYATATKEQAILMSLRTLNNISAMNMD